MLTVIRLSQLENAPTPIEVTLVGIVKEEISVDAKALSPNPTTATPLISAGIVAEVISPVV